MKPTNKFMAHRPLGRASLKQLDAETTKSGVPLTYHSRNLEKAMLSKNHPRFTKPKTPWRTWNPLYLRKKPDA